jgi:hypothetical protein
MPFKAKIVQDAVWPIQTQAIEGSRKPGGVPARWAS